MTPPWRRSSEEADTDLPYVPTEADLRAEETPEWPGPVLSAASNPDPKILAGLLADGRFSMNDHTFVSSFGQWRNPLTESVLSELPTNTELLLEHGADPNGFHLANFSAYSSSFIRHREPKMTHPWPVGRPPRDEALVGIDQAQTGPITTDEIISRFTTRARFWAEANFPSTTHPPYARPPMTAMEAAAKVGDLLALDRLAEAGADTVAWRAQLDSIPVDATASSLTVATPLHRAVEAGNLETVEFLLSRGHRPDIFPLAPITRSMNAVMYAVAKAPPWIPGLEAMALYANFSLCTPIYRCHILHFAAAQLDLGLLKHVIRTAKTDLKSLQPTALGHTLLHVACLPQDETYINIHSVKIFSSIHELRTLKDTQPLERIVLPELWPREVAPANHTAQHDVVRYLLDACGDACAELSKQDAYGNTALHYLAGNRCINETLLAELQKLVRLAGTSDPWSEIQNLFGHTANDLNVDGEAARVHWNSRKMPFW